MEVSFPTTVNPVAINEIIYMAEQYTFLTFTNSTLGICQYMKTTK